MKNKATTGIILTLLFIGMLTLAFDSQPAKAESTTWTVDYDGPADLHTIQEAINAASPGDIIYVSSGTYYENVVVNKTVSLIGENGGTTIIDGSGTGTVVTIDSDKSLLCNFTIQNGDWGVWFDYTHGSVLKRNDITNNSRGNIRVSADPWWCEDFFNDVDSSNTVDGKPVCWWTNQSNKTVPLNVGCVILVYSTNITVQDLSLSNNDVGVLLVCTRGSIVQNVSTNCNWAAGIHLIRSNNNSIVRNRVISNSFHGIRLDPMSNHNIIIENEISNNSYGIWLKNHSSNNTLSGNNVYLNDNLGIRLEEGSCSNVIFHNNANNNGIGIQLADSSDNRIVGNTVINNTVTHNDDYGILIDTCSQNTIINNTVSRNYRGVYLQYSFNNTLRANNIFDNRYNFGVWGSSLSHFIQDVDASNTVDGKPIYYLVNQHDQQIPTDAGYVAVVNSTDITVRNLDLKRNVQGVLFAYTINSKIENVNTFFVYTPNLIGIHLIHSTNNTIERNINLVGDWYSIYLYDSNHNNVYNNTVKSTISIRYSSENIVRGNTISTNSRGMWLGESNENIIHDNILSGNGESIFLVNSKNNAISRNTLIENLCGIDLKFYSSDNIIYHNNFIDNANQTRIDETSSSIWDNGYPSGGNYWSDHVCTGNPSNGSQPYVIDESNIDHYPFQDPNGWVIQGDVNGDGIVDIVDVVIAALTFGSTVAEPNIVGNPYDPRADLNNDGIVDIVDLVIIGVNFGKKLPL